MNNLLNDRHLFPVTQEDRMLVVKAASDAFTAVLKPAGFRKSALNWRHHTDGLVHVVNLQRSQWGGEFYVNLGVHFQDMGFVENPMIQKCAVIARLRLRDEDPELHDFELARRYDSNLTLHRREEVLKYALLEYAIPHFANFRTLAVAKHSLSNVPTILTTLIIQDVYKFYRLTRPLQESSS